MTDKQHSNEGGFPSPEEMRFWLDREIADAAKAMELRIKDASRIIADYSRGAISPDEAADRTFEYSNRWRQALPGVARSEGLTDSEILRRIDEQRALELLPEDKYQQRLRQSLRERSR